MSLDLRVLQSHDVEILANVAPGVFDRPLDPRLVTEFLNDGRTSPGCSRRSKTERCPSG